MDIFIARLKFAWHLWQREKYDGAGHRIDLWYALSLAWNDEFWGL